MNVVDHLSVYIQSLQDQGFKSNTILSALNDILRIRSSVDEERRLVVLNYDQCHSPKHHPITTACRSLVLDLDDLSVVSQAFDRFFNYGETDCGYNCSQLTAYAKEDGSLLSVFNHKGQWMYRTKSMIMPIGMIDGGGTSWKDFIERCIGWESLQEKLDVIDESITLIFEICGEENKVVHEYDGDKAFLLSARLRDGRYAPDVLLQEISEYLEIPRPESFTFGSMSDCAYAASRLPDLAEGYVWYNRHGEPVCKVKNPAYVAAHYLRGERVKSPKRILNMIVENEQDEYLSIFPEDRHLFEPYLDAMEGIFKEAREFFKEHRALPRKEYAALASNEIFKGLAYGLYDGRECFDSFKSVLPPGRVRLLNKYKDK